VQYPTLWLPVGLIAAVLVGAALWPGERFTRVVVALALIVLVIVGYLVLPSVFDVDTLFRE
jgi:ABC-type sugar transport system permease subunit